MAGSYSEEIVRILKREHPEVVRAVFTPGGVRRA